MYSNIINWSRIKLHFRYFNNTKVTYNNMGFRCIILILSNIYVWLCKGQTITRIITSLSRKIREAWAPSKQATSRVNNKSNNNSLITSNRNLTLMNKSNYKANISNTTLSRKSSQTIQQRKGSHLNIRCIRTYIILFLKKRGKHKYHKRSINFWRNEKILIMHINNTTTSI